MYVLKWSDRDGIYGQPQDAGKFVTVDHVSGGYPCPVSEIGRATIFSTYEEADRYRQMFDTLDLYWVKSYTLERQE